MERYQLSPNYSISRVIKGGWQLSSGHDLKGKLRSEQEHLADMEAFRQGGITSFDFGDIYTGVEELVGKFIQDLKKTYGEAVRQTVQLHTKYVPDRSLLAEHRPKHVQNIVDRSRSRLGVDQIDLVQFHWWDYEIPGYLEALEELFKLRAQGVIREVGVTNFNTSHLREFVEAGLKPRTVQVQYSLLDRRPESSLQTYCQEEGISLLCYGTVAGGFLSDRFYGASNPPHDETRSQTKYRLIIEEFGGWSLYQDLLQVLHSTAKKYDTDIASIASAWVLNQPAVAGVIVGARNIDHLRENLSISRIFLDKEDGDILQSVLERSNPSRGDVYEFERNDPRHSGIMRMNLNDH